MRYLSKAIIPSPIGKLHALASENGLCALTFEEDSNFMQIKILKSYPNAKFTQQFHNVLKETKTWLDHYFARRFNNLQAPSIDLQGSDFAIKTWKKLLQIPVGKTQSYGELAKKLKRPTAARAIGRIMGLNPIVILFPCHRIIGAHQTLTGYGGGLHRKRWLLQHEGYEIN